MPTQMTLPAASARVKSAAMSAVTLAGGVSLAVIPAATLSISSRVFSLAENGIIAVAIMVATFVGQLTFAAVVESRLSSHTTERRVTFPPWLATLSLLAAATLIVKHTNVVALCLGLPLLVASLEVGRGVSVAERLDRREIWASIAVGGGALVGVLAAFSDARWALVPLIVGIFVATAARCLPVSHRASRPHPSAMVWVVADVGITGIIFPLINTLILFILGPIGAVLFTAISTVSGLLAIPINFLRLRLLKERSRLDLWVSVGSLIIAVVALLVFEFAGFFSLLFGSAWSMEATLVPLVVACAWRAASLAPTLPFTALRRMGLARRVTMLRAGASLIALALASIALLTLNIIWIFAALLLAELLSGLIYERARRRAVRTALTPPSEAVS